MCDKAPDSAVVFVLAASFSASTAAKEDGAPYIVSECMAGGSVLPSVVMRVSLAAIAYMPPEQALGQEATPQADLYALGCLLYELVSGRPPVVGDDAVAVISQHLNTCGGSKSIPICWPLTEPVRMGYWAATVPERHAGPRSFVYFPPGTGQWEASTRRPPPVPC